MLNRIEDAYASFVAAVGAGFAGALVWLVRTIFTNQKKLDKLEAEIAAREARRDIEMQTLVEMKNDLREVRADVRTLFHRQGGN